MSRTSSTPTAVKPFTQMPKHVRVINKMSSSITDVHATNLSTDRIQVSEKRPMENKIQKPALKGTAKWHNMNTFGRKLA